MNAALEEFRQTKDEKMLRVAEFLVNYAEDHAVLLRGNTHRLLYYPGGRPPPGPEYQYLNRRKLPSSFSTATVWRVYKHAAQKLGAGRAVNLSDFKRVWQRFLPLISCEEPMDLCFLCYNLTDMPEDMRGDTLSSHLDILNTEMASYQETNARCARTCKESRLSLAPSLPSSRDITMSYSFDFAQQLHYPSEPQKPGPLYFLIPRKCLLFGVCCGGMPKQVSYLIDEGMMPVPWEPTTHQINYLHHFFHTYGVGEWRVDLCTSEENKSHGLLEYFAWRTMHGLHQRVELHFRPAGHDASGPDALFGLVKQAFRRTRVQTLADIAQVVRDSTPRRQLNIPQLVGMEDGTILVKSYKWHQELCSYFRVFPDIDGYRHFSFDARRPGVVTAKAHCYAEPFEFQLLSNPDILPPWAVYDFAVQFPPWLSACRQRYLFEKVRQFCSDEAKDITCPPPESNSAPVRRCAHDVRRDTLWRTKPH